MTIEVTGCHGCPFRDVDLYCGRICEYVFKYLGGGYPPSCPLKQETITIKLKSDEKQENGN